MTIDEIKKALEGLEDLGSSRVWSDDQSLQFYQALFLGEIALKLALIEDKRMPDMTERLRWIKEAVR